MAPERVREFGFCEHGGDGFLERAVLAFCDVKIRAIWDEGEQIESIGTQVPPPPRLYRTGE